MPEAYLEDETFAALLEEAEKYLGYPYVRGGSNPNTSFDCSGFLSWVLTNSGVCDTGRLGGDGPRSPLHPRLQPPPRRPGFLQGHLWHPRRLPLWALRRGRGMLHCGDTIGYANLNTSYWQSHFFAHGRIPQEGHGGTRRVSLCPLVFGSPSSPGHENAPSVSLDKTGLDDIIMTEGRCRTTVSPHTN